MMTRRILNLSVLVLCVGLAACGKKEAPAPASQPTATAPIDAPAKPAVEKSKTLEEATAPKTLPGLPGSRDTKVVMPATLRKRLKADEAGVRRWIFQNKSALVTEVKLRKVSLDTDPQDEFIAVVPFSPRAGEAYDWIVLLDGQKDHFVVAKDWTRRGVDAKAHVVAHGQGGRPMLVVEVTHKGRTAVELWRMQAAGNLVSVATYGIEVGESASFKAPNVIEVKREGSVERVRLVATEKGFDRVSSDQ